MQTLVPEPVSRSKRKPVASTEVKSREFVPEGPTFYKVAVQVGPYRGGRFPGSNRWLKKTGAAAGDKDYSDPEYRVYEQIMSADETNGWIALNNEWLTANQRRDQNTRIGRLGDLVAVLDVEEAKGFVPKNATFVNIPVDLLSSVIDKIVDAKLAALTSGGKSSGKSV